MTVQKTFIPHIPRNRFLQNSGDVAVYKMQNSSTGGVTNNFTAKYIWGQYFDGIRDIEGDMANVGNIDSDGVISTTDSVVANKLYVNQSELQGITRTNNVLPLSDKTYNIGSAEREYFFGFFENLIAQYVQCNSAKIREIVANVISANNINVETLTVTGAAHFFKLVIDEVKSMGGQLVITAANMRADNVVQLTSDKYRVYSKSKESGSDVTLQNQWCEDDLAMCQTFNVESGFGQNIANKNYWAKVTATGTISAISFESESTKVAVADALQTSNGQVTSYDATMCSDLSFTQAQKQQLREFDEYRYFTSLTSVGEKCFESSQIKSVTIPRYVTQIARYAFMYCRNLTSVNFNSALTTIRDYAFRMCNLQRLVLPSSLTTVKLGAFSRNTQLTDVYFLGVVPPTFENYVFEGCTSLQRIVVPNGTLEAYKDALRNEGSDYQDFVTEIGTETVTIPTFDDEIDNYIYIDLDMSNCSQATNSVPEVGDEIVQLGNTTQGDRQAAIIISAYQSIDSGIQAPSFVQYDGINSFDLTHHRINVVSKNKNEFRGDFKITVDSQTVNVEDYAAAVNSSIAALEVTASGITSEVASLKKGKNLMTGPLTGYGWYDNNLDAATINNEFICMGAQASTLVSPTIDVSTGKQYTLSFEGSATSVELTVYKKNAQETIWTDFSKSSQTKKFAQTISMGGYNQVYFEFSCNVKHPQLEAGNAATEFVASTSETSSLVTQTANSITSRVSAIENDYVTTATLTQTANSITSRVSAIENDYVTTATLTQTANSITSRVSAIENDYVTTATLTQTANSITSRVSEIENNYIDSSTLSSTISQTSTQIKAAIDSSLGSTGIDITNGAIELRADKVTFANSDGTVTNKITIDSLTGALRATDGTFDGIVKASLLYSRVKTVTTTPYTIDPATDPANAFYYVNPRGIKRICLPDATTYDGLEVMIYVRESETVDVTQNRVRCYSVDGSPVYIFERNIKSVDGAVLRNYNVRSQAVNYPSTFALITNCMYRFKAMGGGWQTLEGMFTGE